MTIVITKMTRHPCRLLFQFSLILQGKDRFQGTGWGLRYLQSAEPMQSWSKVFHFYSPLFFFVGRIARRRTATAGLDLWNNLPFFAMIDFNLFCNRKKSGKNQKCSGCQDKDCDRGIAITSSCISNRNDLCPKAFPEPRITYKTDTGDTTVNPRPIPSPSKIDGRNRFLGCITSARPRMIQLTTIRGI